MALLVTVALVFVACRGRDEQAVATVTAVPATTTEPTTTEPATTEPVTTAEPAPTAEPVTTVADTVAPVTSVAVAGRVPAIGTTTEGSIVTTDGRTRTYRVYVPSSLPVGAPVALLVALHGGTGWGAQFERNSGFDEIAEANGFLVVYPDGVGIGADGTDTRTWNAGVCCGPAARTGVDDVGFVRQLIDRLATEFTIDPRRTYAAGHSNGGFLAYRLACELSDRIVAVGLQAGGLTVPSCTPTRPVSLLHVHGTADTNVPIVGGVGTGLSKVDFPPALDSVTTVATADGCAAGPVITTDPSNADLTISTWTPCAADAEVRFVAVAGATHAYMGSTRAQGAPADVGVPYAGLDVSLLIWQFLADHPRAG